MSDDAMIDVEEVVIQSYKTFCPTCRKIFRDSDKSLAIKQALACKATGTPLVHTFKPGDKVLMRRLEQNETYNTQVVIEKVLFEESTHYPLYRIRNLIGPVDAKDVRQIIYGVVQSSTTPEISEKPQMTIKEAKAKHEQTLLKLSNVTGVALGQKEQAGKEVGRIAIVVFVTDKIPESRLSPQDIVPKNLEGYETDVVESRDVWAL